MKKVVTFGEILLRFASPGYTRLFQKDISVQSKGLANFDKKIKYVMPELNSIDIDNMLDWKLCEVILQANTK